MLRVDIINSSKFRLQAQGPMSIAMAHGLDFKSSSPPETRAASGSLVLSKKWRTRFLGLL